MTAFPFMPGVPEAYVRARLAKAAGNEIGSGNLWSPVSSAALAANAFGWFVERPAMIPPLPGRLAAARPHRVEIEYCARFPWSGGTHPWLDAALFDAGHLVGVESKRFEPFRDHDEPSFSPAYDRPVWGERMGRYAAVRDALRSGALRYVHLNAAQLVKHAFGLVTQGRRSRLLPMLFYVFAEPSAVGGRLIPSTEIGCHRDEVSDFTVRVEGDEVSFASASYREWLAGASGAAAEHAAALVAQYGL